MGSYFTVGLKEVDCEANPMVAGMPDRPLYFEEAWNLAGRGSIRFALPGALESMRFDSEGRQRLHDLILFTETSTTALSYLETDKEWVVIGKKEGEETFEEVHQELLEYRGYDSTTEMMQEVIFDALADLVMQGEIDKAALERELNK